MLQCGPRKHSAKDTIVDELRGIWQAATPHWPEKTLQVAQKLSMLVGMRVGVCHPCAVSVATHLLRK